jgi:hypothetical protein
MSVDDRVDNESDDADHENIRDDRIVARTNVFARDAEPQLITRAIPSRDDENRDARRAVSSMRFAS